MASFEWYFRKRVDRAELLKKYMAFDQLIATSLMVDFSACDTMMELVNCNSEAKEEFAAMFLADFKDWNFN